MKQDIVVVGAGIAGLAAAARLAHRGHRVRVYEQGSLPGGKIAPLKHGDFYWDAGPSFFTDKKEFDRLFKDLGKNPSDYYTILELDEACRYFFPGGEIVHGYDTAMKLAQELEHVFGEPKKNTLAYLERAATLYQTVAQRFLNEPFSMGKIMNPDAIKAMAHIPLDLLYGSMHDIHCQYFRRSEVVMLFDRFATYNGSNPYRAPGMLSCLPHLEHNLGAYYVKGGMHALAQAAEKVAKEEGVRIFSNTPVKKITHSGTRATGVLTDSGWQEADIIVSAVDINFLYSNLLPIRSHRVKKYVVRERSLSAIVFYWAMDRKFDNLGLHNIFFSHDYGSETTRLWNEKLPAIDPTVYVNITSKYDSEHASKDGENWFVMVNAPSRVDIDCQERVKKRVIKRLEATLGVPVAKHIIYEDRRTPKDFEALYNAMQGALYGASSNSFEGAFLRHPNVSPDYKNVYTVGVSTHPGGGIPLALRSARIVDGMLKRR